MPKENWCTWESNQTSLDKGIERRRHSKINFVGSLEIWQLISFKRALKTFCYYFDLVFSARHFEKRLFYFKLK